MRYIRQLAGLILIFTFSNSGFAGKVTGTVERIRVHGPEHTGGRWSPPLFWFTLNEVESAGSCATFGDNVLWVAEHEYFLSILLAAQSSGKEIEVNYDEDTIVNTYCRALYITVK
jgi:hypothetical protein